MPSRPPNRRPPVTPPVTPAKCVTRVEKSHQRRKATKKRATADDASLQETAQLFLKDLLLPTDISAKSRDRITKSSTDDARRPNKRLQRSSKSSSRSDIHGTPAKVRRSEQLKVPLEEGGDAEDRAVSTEVLAYTSAFLSNLSSLRTSEFWGLRGAARGEDYNPSSKRKAAQPSKQQDGDESVSSTESSEPSHITESDDESPRLTERDPDDDASENSPSERMDEEDDESSQDSIWSN